MNEEQFTRELKSRLEVLAWSHAVLTIFDNVRLFAGAAIDDLQESDVDNEAIIVSEEFETDDDDKPIQNHKIEVILCKFYPTGGDPEGEDARLDETGMFRMREKVISSIRELSNDSGVFIQFQLDEGSAITRSPRRDGVECSLGFIARLSADRHYPPPTRLKATGGSGQIALTWTLPYARYDRMALVLRRASGSTPPASQGAGDSVTLSGPTATSKTDTGLAAGTYSYSLFVGYDTSYPLDGVVDSYSSPHWWAQVTGVAT